MDLRKLSRAMSPPANSANANANGTQQLNLAELSPTILDALIPGYSVISRYVQAAFGVDISLFVSLGIIFLAVTKGGQYIASQIERIFRYLFVSSVYIDDGDDLFDMVMAWMDAREASSYRRAVRAKTQRGSQLQDTVEFAASEALDENGLFNYNKWAARTPPRYEPYYGRHFIWHQGSVFLFRRSRKLSQQQVSVNFSRGQTEDLLQLDCIGRSTQPIKELLRSIKSWSLNKKRHTTTIRHPTPKDRARSGGAWSKTSSRPSRPMDTVILDTEQKSVIVKDMNEYLHPSSPKWYATRGIPYRRGYLFHGPPGTGKTSLSFALAGIFSLEIYAISLQEPTLTEGDLMQLFNGLPRICVVLLEDVDAAGLLRDNVSRNSDGKKEKTEKKDDGERAGAKKEGQGKEKEVENEEEYTLRDLAKELKAISAPKGGAKVGANENSAQGGRLNRAPGTGISLSGLLNAIDGVATHEGRVLIMTTNHPEKLDAALVRPGRVDRKVEFKLAMNEQIRELFIRMYAEATEAERMPHGRKNSAANGSAVKPSLGEKELNGFPKGTATGAEDELAALTAAELTELAEEFAKHVPGNTFTPAEIQNHLMRYKNLPRTAVDTVDEWQKTLLEEKERQEEKERERDDEDDD